jgi:mannosyl-3-phosphoglycerate phosphatase family protein
MLTKRLLIYTDLDGTLLDHHNYSHEAADDMLVELTRMHVPVVPATSKTAAEMLEIRKELDNIHPFIIENGAAVYIPGNYFSVPPPDTAIIDGFRVRAFTRPRQHWQSLLDTLPEFTGCYTTFQQAGIKGIMEMTGLDAAAAARASQRDYGEPVSWHGTAEQKQAFIKRLAALGASVLQGGRFMHVSGNCDKGKALQWLTRQYQADAPDSDFTTVAVGDSQNDIAMLEAADIALLVRSPVNTMPVIDRKQKCIRSSAYGPKGWAEGMNIVLDFMRNPDSDII